LTYLIWQSYSCGLSELKNIKIDPVKLRAARGDRKLSEVARIVSASKQILWNYENGHNQMSAAPLAKLCILYQTSIEDLTTADENFLQIEYSVA
jgi:transcriptional regulator with XRE-family HTH domain